MDRPQSSKDCAEPHDVEGRLGARRLVEAVCRQMPATRAHAR
jgi:hypothetical protein